MSDKRSYYRKTIFSTLNQEETQPSVKRTSDQYYKIVNRKYENGVPSHDEVLLQKEGAPKMIPVKEREEEGLENLPESDLLEAIHYYFARNFAHVDGFTINPYERQMDESALLAMGVLVEHMVDDFVAQEGYFKHAVDQNEEKMNFVNADASAKTVEIKSERARCHKNRSKIQKSQKNHLEERRIRLKSYKIENQKFTREFAEIHKDPTDSESCELEEEDDDDEEEKEDILGECDNLEEESSSSNEHGNQDSIDDFYEAEDFPDVQD